jgi:transposase-like protein
MVAARDPRHLRRTRRRPRPRPTRRDRRNARRRVHQGRDHPAGPTDELAAFADFPDSPWNKIRSANPLEQVKTEIRRRIDAVGVSSNPAGLLRLAGSLLLETQ